MHNTEAQGEATSLYCVRAVWVGLLALLLIYGWPQAMIWRVAAGVPWLVGAILIAVPATARKVATAWPAAFASTGARVAGIFIALTLALIGWALSTLALLLGFVWFGAALIALCAWTSGGSARSLVQNAAMLSCTLVVATALGEFLFRRPAIAGTLGLPSEQRRVEASYDAVPRHNLFGFRSRHDRVTKAPGVFRIIGIGDSFTWGDHIASTDSTWPSQLEQLLTSPSRPVEVVNMAVRGYTTVNEVEALNRIGWQFKPDLVVLQWLVNDVYPSGPDFKNLLIWPPVPNLLPEAFRSGAVRSSDLYGFLQQRYAAWRLGERHGGFPGLYVDSNPDWGANKAAFRELGDSARVLGVPVVVMLWPEIGEEAWTPETHPFRAIHAKVADVAREAGLHVFDLTALFAAAGKDGRRWWVKPYDRHPSPAADRLVVHALCDYLEAEGLLTGAYAHGSSKPHHP
jgi:hypothetical protein